MELNEKFDNVVEALESIVLDIGQSQVKTYNVEISISDLVSSVFEKLNERMINLNDDAIKGKMKEAKEIMDKIDYDWL